MIDLLADGRAQGLAQLKCKPLTAHLVDTIMPPPGLRLEGFLSRILSDMLLFVFCSTRFLEQRAVILQLRCPPTQ